MAKEQIINEKYWKYEGENRIGKAIAELTGKILKELCEMEPEFEQAIRQSDKSFTDCIDAVSFTISRSGHTSDFDVFKKAVKFYFPGATINYHVSINMSGEVEAEAAKKKPYKKPELIEAPPAPEPEKKKNFGFDLDDLLDF